MRRTFGFDVLACPRCDGRLRLIALIEEVAVVLEHSGISVFLPTCRRPSRRGAAVLATAGEARADEYEIDASREAFWLSMGRRCSDPGTRRPRRLTLLRPVP
jgi:hypothetical protein